MSWFFFGVIVFRNTVWKLNCWELLQKRITESFQWCSIPMNVSKNFSLGRPLLSLKRNAKKKPSRTAIYSVNVAVKMLVEHTPNHLQKKPVIPAVVQRKVSVAILPEGRIEVLEVHEIEPWRKINIKWTLLHFRTIKTQIEGTQSKIVPPEKSQKKVNVSSDIDWRIEICRFREGRIRISRCLNTKSTFVTFDQSGLKLTCRKIFSWWIEMSSPP